MDCDRYHLDAALAYALSKPETVAEPSGITGSITITTDDAAFVVGDVGKVLWINNGRATITAYTSAVQVTATVTSELMSDDPCPANRWGIGTPTATLSGASHLEGKTVRVWGDMADLGDFVVSSGAVTLPQSVSVAYLGLTNRSRWKSLKLAYGAQKGSALGMRKAIRAITLLLYRTGASFKFGQASGPSLKRAFDRLRPIKIRTPETPYGEPVPLFSGESENAFDAKFDPDSRLVFEIDGPAPATVSGYVPTIDEHDRG
jgi:hypothetical protein